MTPHLVLAMGVQRSFSTRREPGMPPPIRLAVVDDHPLFREGAARCLKDLGFEAVGEGSDSDDALRLAEQKIFL